MSKDMMIYFDDGREPMASALSAEHACVLLPLAAYKERGRAVKEM